MLVPGIRVKEIGTGWLEEEGRGSKSRRVGPAAVVGPSTEECQQHVLPATQPSHTRHPLPIFHEAVQEEKGSNWVRSRVGEARGTIELGTVRERS